MTTENGRGLDGEDVPREEGAPLPPKSQKPGPRPARFGEDDAAAFEVTRGDRRYGPSDDGGDDE